MDKDKHRAPHRERKRVRDEERRIILENAVDDCKTLDEVGEMLGVSRERARQLYVSYGIPREPIQSGKRQPRSIVALIAASTPETHPGHSETFDGYPLALGRPTLDYVMRTRAYALIQHKGSSVRKAAAGAGCNSQTLYRRLCRTPNGTSYYLRLHINDLDDLLNGNGWDVSELLSPVLLAGDVDLLTWVETRTRKRGGLAMVSDLPRAFGGRPTVSAADRAISQGLMVVCGEREDPTTWHLRLTSAGHVAASS